MLLVGVDLLSGSSDIIVMNELLDMCKLVMKIREARPGLLPMVIVLVLLVLLLDPRLDNLQQVKKLKSRNLSIAM